jgi:predicted metalloprotease with PDZ domain
MPTISYSVRFPAPATHYVEVEACIPADGKRQLALFLPVWTPGSYLIREYARHIEGLAAHGLDGTALATVKIRKNRWQVTSDHPLDQIIVSYRLYCNELSVRTNYLDEEFALLCGAATFVTTPNHLQSPHQVTLELPSGWQSASSAMPGMGSQFSAANYDVLVDCPIVAGNPALHEFDVDGRRHILINIGDSRSWDLPQAAKDVERIVRQHRVMWGELPYERYLFFNLLTGGRGALEHANSMVMMADRLTMCKRSDYAAWLDLVSHEYFHVWNVKRLRPRELGPFDYENEVYTSNLWISEGFTDYYAALALRRSGLITDQEFLGSDASGPDDTTSLSGMIEKLQTTPGRLQQPVSLASFDAWIKAYRPDENSANSSISYYTKGAVIAWLLDAHIRSTTNNERSLDDVMRLAIRRYSSQTGFTGDEFYKIVQEVTGQNINSWFDLAVDSTEELDYTEALTWFGLRFKTVKNTAESPAKAWSGLEAKTENGRLVVSKVLRESPAWRAGITPGDEIIAIDGYRVRPDQWERRMEQYHPGQMICLLIAHRDRLVKINVPLSEAPVSKWRLEVDPSAGEAPTKRFADWLNSITTC